MDAEIAQVVAHIPQLRSYARALVRRADGADDLVQDCLQRAIEKIHLFERGSNMRAWLFTIMHNVHISHVRRRHDASRSSTPDIAPDDIAAGALPQEQVNDLRDLEAALATLSSEQREILHLVGVEELAYGDIARMLEIPMGTVMSRLHRAREALRNAMYGEAKSTLRRIK